MVATVTAYVAFNGDDLDLYRLTASWTSWQFWNDAPTAWNGIVYPDTYRVNWNGGYNFTEFKGGGITIDPWTGAVTGGTVTGLLEGFYSGGTMWLSGAIQGISVSATALYSASLTPWTTDDYGIIQSALAGADSFILSAGADLARGYNGNDTMQGFNGNDSLFGGNGNDKLKGQNNSDWLAGEAGKDTLTGGKGNDAFVFYAPKEGGDKVTDFHNKKGDNDLFKIDASSFRGGLDKGRLSADEFQVSSNNHADENSVRFIFRTTDETLWFDKNGERAGGLKLIADLQGSADLTHHDILLF